MSTITLQTQVLQLHLRVPFEQRMQEVLSRLGEHIPEGPSPEETIAYALHYLVHPRLVQEGVEDSVWEIKEKLEALLAEILPEGTVEAYLQEFADDALACEMLYAERAEINDQARRRGVEAMRSARETLEQRASHLQTLLVQAQGLEEIAKEDANKTQTLVKHIKENLL